MRIPRSNAAHSASCGGALLFLSAVAAFAGILHPAAALQMDAAQCERVLHAPSLINSSYATVPPRYRARSFPVVDVRRLFSGGEPNKTTLAKRSLAEDIPIVCTANAAGAFDAAGETWRPAASPRQSSGECGGAMTLIGYDNAQYGGAFEVMASCGSSSQGQRFFWVRYEDFERFCGCAVEVVGSHGGAERPPQLTASIRFQDASGAAMRAQRQGRAYRLEGNYAAGTEFRVFLTSHESAYVYAFTSDLTGAVHPVFPAEGRSPLLAYNDNQLALPDEKSYLKLDNDPGTDYFCALYSTRRLNFPEIARQIERAQGDLPSRVRAALQNDLIPETRIRDVVSSGDIAIAATGGDQPALPVIVEIDHVRRDAP